MAERYTPEQLRILSNPRFQDAGGLTGPAGRALMERVLNQREPSSTLGGQALDALGLSGLRRMQDRAPTTQDWIDAQGSPSTGGGLQAIRGLPAGFTLVPDGPVPGPMAEAIGAQLPAGWNGTMPSSPLRKAEAAQALAGGQGEGSILPYTGMPRFLTELGLRLAASKNPDFLGALGESALGSFGSTEQAEERKDAKQIAKAQAQRQALLAQAQVNQLNASAMEAMDRIGRPKDVKMLTTGDGVVAALQDGDVKIVIDPRTGQPMKASDPDALKVLSSIIEANFGDIDAISENIGPYTDVIKKFRSAGSDLYQPKEAGTVNTQRLVRTGAGKFEPKK